jgi:predicted CxxxxCH...CXXCH cytochrome family protein
MDALHLNQEVSLLPSLNYNSATYNSAELTGVVVGGTNFYGTCSTTTCHQNGRGIIVESPAWNAATSDTNNCTLCHGVTNNGIPVSATPLTQGSHDVHVTAMPSQYNSVAVSSTEGTYEFACSNCHPDVLAKHLNSSNWATPTVDLSLNNTDGGTLKSLNNVANDTSGYAQTTGTSVTCSAAYCHSYVDAAGARQFPATPNWYSTGFAGDACAGCHGNSPVSNAHGVHEVGIHFDTIYTGGSGLQTAGSTGDNAHGSATTSTVIGCMSCHNDTVKAWFNDDNTTCGTAACHGVTAPAQGGLENASNTKDTANFKKTLHLNGSIDVAFQNIAPKTRAQVRNGIENVPELFSNWERQNGGILDWLLFYKHTDDYDQAKSTLNSATFSAGTCSAVACHNGYDIEWNKTQASYSCDACHTQLP